MKCKSHLIIGLTGGVGAGKTTVSSYLLRKGYPVIDADKTAKEIVASGSHTLYELADVFGKAILNEDGSLNRRRLADMAFSDIALKERMDKIMHGEIFLRMEKRIDEIMETGYTGIIFLDVPLLLENGDALLKKPDEIWVIDADEETRIERVTKRDGISRQDVLKIINNQMSSEKKRAKAHVIIENSGSEEELYQQIDKLIKRHEQ